MTAYIKLKRGLREDCNLVVPDKIGKQIKLTKWGSPDGQVKPCEPSTLLDLGETFCGSYRDIEAVWFEKDREDTPSDPQLTDKELQEQAKLLEKYRPDSLKNKVELPSPEEVKESEEELAEFNKNQ